MRANYRGKPERVFIFRLSLWDGNCPQHINPRYTEEQIQELPECQCCDPNPGRFSGTLEVAKIIEETENVKTFRLVQPGGGEIPFEYLPGQFLTLDVEPEGKRTRRSYTIASTPTRPECLEITVKREEMGLVSRYLHNEVKPGHHVRLSGPAGKFTFTGKDRDSVVLIAAGVGITPMMSVARYLTDEKWDGEIFLVLSFRNLEDFIFRREIEGLKERHNNLHVEVTLSRPNGDWTGTTGRIRKDLIADFVPETATRLFHICGPEPMMRDVQAMLEELEVPKEQVKIEAFGTVKRKPKSDGTGAEQLVVSNATVTFASVGKTAPLPPDEPILNVADSIGVEIDNACRSGTCGSCKVKLVSGNVTMEWEDALTEKEKAQGVILACQATAKSGVVIDVYRPERARL